ncbi:TadE/TadG family type IV pilus assembly protein [uncultured Rhodospira sp.]|uniref:TadE/TadG family type IV pilus assembly protein n=1 Tax=uncultured Rhodospira sp. TaxID=1936189 RepID=UPI0026210483|nr:TadE/TadG family type IV pilus assembly protein [uncultured Rhodospira sp.]
MRRYTPTWIGRILRRLRRDTRGVTVIVFGLLMAPLFLALGGAVDLGVAYYLKNRLGYAVDAAALAVGSTVDEAVDIMDRARDFVIANYPDDTIGHVHDIVAFEVDNVVTVSAKATFDTFFMKLFSLEELTVYAESEVIRAIKGLEVAMVLDNTGSMRGNNNIGALRDASEDFVKILFGSETVHPKLFVSIVPYAASVNPGPEAFGGHTSPTAPAWWPEESDPNYVPFEWNPDDGGSFADGLGWKGCVMERTGSDLLGDDDPAGWEAWAWEPDPSNDYDLEDMEGTVRYNPSTYQNSGTGPNLGCPSPIIPLTNKKGDLIDVVRGLDAWHRGGTMADIGLAWGRRVLSPEPPFTEGQPWNKELWEKAIVMMTDGVNQFYKLPNDAGPNEEYEDVNSDYTGIGWLSSDNPRIGTNNMGAANDTIDDRMAAMCEELKQKGIIVYTVTFSSGIDQATKDLYRNCATDPTKWFDSPTQADLKASFKAIAVELSNLRVSR